jgi:6-phosphogluconolactonase
MTLIEYQDRSHLMAALARVLEAALGAALTRKPRVILAVPGGTTPGPLFDVLSGAALDWDRVHVLLTDERWVPESDPASNAALIRARLLKGHAAAAQFTPYYKADMDIAAAARALSVALEPALPIDVLLLGMGADMHTASLFPGAQGLAAALSPDAPMLLPVHPTGQPAQRFSLTAPALRAAGTTHLLITGNDKRAALLQAEGMPIARAPVNIVLPNATVHWSAQ